LNSSPFATALPTYNAASPWSKTIRREAWNNSIKPG
jgi:hypothetical protein